MRQRGRCRQCGSGALAGMRGDVRGAPGQMVGPLEGEGGGGRLVLPVILPSSVSPLHFPLSAFRRPFPSFSPLSYSPSVFVFPLPFSVKAPPQLASAYWQSAPKASPRTPSGRTRRQLPTAHRTSRPVPS
eukprot:7837036-Pyramimonas_sp.AAC.1